jgi:hypothetical protein
MSTTATIPVTITPEAAAHIQELGLQREFEHMLEHTKQVIPSLRTIRVEMSYEPDPCSEPVVILWAHRDDPGPDPDQTDWDWNVWQVNTFPPDVFRHFAMLPIFEDAHGR